MRVVLPTQLSRIGALRAPALSSPARASPPSATPVLVTLICLVTGGPASPFFPFYYFTLLAAAFRFGWRETLGLLVLNSGLTVFLYLVAPGVPADMSVLIIGIFHLSFSAALGVLLARWAQENLDLALDRARALSGTGPVPSCNALSARRRTSAAS